MPEIPEAAYIILYIAPGLLLVQTLRLGGIGRSLEGLDRLTLVVVAGVLIRWVGPDVAGLLALEMEAGLDFELALLGLALALGCVVSFGKRAYQFIFAFGGEDEEETPPKPRRPQPAEQPEQKAQKAEEPREQTEE